MLLYNRREHRKVRFILSYLNKDLEATPSDLCLEKLFFSVLTLTLKHHLKGKLEI